MHSVSKKRRLSSNMATCKFDVSEDFIVCKTLYEKSFSKFNEMRSNLQLCDVKLKAKNGKNIWAHKLVLAASSEYFSIMFNGQFKESSVTEIFVQQFDASILNLMIDFIYTSKLSIAEQNIHEILNGICLLQFNEEVQKQCFNYIKTRVNPANCLGIKEITECLGLQELSSFCSKYLFKFYNKNYSNRREFIIKYLCLPFIGVIEFPKHLENVQAIYKHIRNVIKHDEFLSITFDQLLQIIQSEQICVGEEIVYSSVVMWTVHDLPNRTKHLPVLLSYVRLITIPLSFMKSITKKQPFLKLNSECVKYLDKAFALQNENNSILKLTYSMGILYRPNYSEYILVMNKNGESRSLMFNAIKQKWKYLSRQFPSIPRNTSYLLNDGRIMNVATGLESKVLDPYNCNNGQEMYELEKIEIIIKSTSGMGEMHTENNIVQVGSKIYVMCYYNSEYYDMLKDKWFKMKYSSNVRTSCSVIAFRGCIYVIGGHIEGCYTNLVEKYNPETYEWTTLSPMKHKRRSVTLCLLNDCIYAIGGTGHKGILLKEVEKYDPTTDTWEDVVSLKYGRNNAGAASLNGYLYVFGGGDKMYAIEKYCPFKNNWTVLKPEIPRSFGRITSCTAFTIGRELQHLFLRFSEPK